MWQGFNSREIIFLLSIFDRVYKVRVEIIAVPADLFETLSRHLSFAQREMDQET